MAILGERLAVAPDGGLTIGGCDAVALAHAYGTPLYVFDEDGVREACRRYRTALARHWPSIDVAYACKAFAVGEMLRLVADEQLGIEVVSEGELALALWAGVEPSRLTLHGASKTAAELDAAVRSGVGHVVIDGIDDIAAIDAAARAHGRRQPALLRVDPGVGVDAHPKYTTSGGSKFGLALDGGCAAAALHAALDCEAIDLAGLHFHLGSQIDVVEPYQAAIGRLAELLRELAPSRAWRPTRIVVGGGMAVRYRPQDAPPSPERWAEAIVGGFRDQLVELCADGAVLGIEPGRSIVAEHGVILYSVGRVKPSAIADACVIVDGGLSDNPRPALYGSHHEVVLAAAAAAEGELTVEVCGRHCEPDRMFSSVRLPRVKPGDVLAVQTAGAYTHAMASNYNRFTRPAVVFARDGASRLVQRREAATDLLRTESQARSRSVSGTRTELIGIVADRIGFEERALIDAARARGADARWINDGALCAGPRAEGVPAADAYLIRSRSYTRGALIAALLEDRGERTLNASRAIAICQSKLETARVLTAAGIPTLDFRLVLGRADLDAAVDALGLPLVLKPVFGGLGRRVLLVRDRDLVHAAYDYVEQFGQGFDRVMLAQAFCDGEDARVVVVGSQIVAAVERQPVDDWRSNAATGATTIPLTATPPVRTLVERVAIATGAELFGLDLFRCGDRYVVNEVNHVPRFEAAEQATRAGIAGLVIDHALGRRPEPSHADAGLASPLAADALDRSA